MSLQTTVRAVSGKYHELTLQEPLATLTSLSHLQLQRLGGHLQRLHPAGVVTCLGFGQQNVRSLTGTSVKDFFFPHDKRDSWSKQRTFSSF